MYINGIANCSDAVMYNAMAKTYRDGSKQILCATKRVFREPGWESFQVYTLDQKRRAAEKEISKAIFRREDPEPIDPDEDILPWWELEPAEWTEAEYLQMTEGKARREWESVQRSLRRAKVKVRDYALSTDMRWFVTFTLDQAKIDRYDIHAVTKKLNQWLNNQVKRKGLAYVMVPELHQDGAIHFHGLINDAMEAVDSGTIIPNGEDRPRMPSGYGQRNAWLRAGGRVVYNLPGWPYGFTTALPLAGSYEQAVNYVCKYISKGLRGEDGLPEKVGGRWYYHGGDLGSPSVEYFNANMEDLQEAFGDAAHDVTITGQLSDVEMIVVWVNTSGVPK